MKLYKIEIELRNKNKKPYAERDYVPLDFDVLNEKSQGALTYTEIPDFEPIFAEVILTTLSKEVDVIKDWGAIPGTGIILSDSFKSVLDKFTLPPHKYYPLTIIHPKKGVLKNPHFYWLQVVTADFLDLVDFHNSQIFLSKVLSPEPEQRVLVKSKRHYQELIDEFFLTTYDSICVNPTIKYDLFYLNHISSDCYINDRLKSAIEEAKITGIECFEPLENVFCKV